MSGVILAMGAGAMGAAAATAVGTSAVAQAAPVKTVATRKDLFIAFRLSPAGPALRGVRHGELSVPPWHGTKVEGTLNLSGPAHQQDGPHKAIS